MWAVRKVGKNFFIQGFDCWGGNNSSLKYHPVFLIKINDRYNGDFNIGLIRYLNGKSCPKLDLLSGVLIISVWLRSNPSRTTHCLFFSLFLSKASLPRVCVFVSQILGICLVFTAGKIVINELKPIYLCWLHILIVLHILLLAYKSNNHTLDIKFSIFFKSTLIDYLRPPGCSYPINHNACKAKSKILLWKLNYV